MGNPTEVINITGTEKTTGLDRDLNQDPGENCINQDMSHDHVNAHTCTTPTDTEAGAGKIQRDILSKPVKLVPNNSKNHNLTFFLLGQCYLSSLVCFKFDVFPLLSV